MRSTGTCRRGARSNVVIAGACNNSVAAAASVDGRISGIGCGIDRVSLRCCGDVLDLGEASRARPVGDRTGLASGITDRNTAGQTAGGDRVTRGFARLSTCDRVIAESVSEFYSVIACAACQVITACAAIQRIVTCVAG